MPPGRANPTTGAAAARAGGGGRRAARGGRRGGGADGDADGIEADEDEEIEYVYIGCTVCAPGTYAELENATACTPCPPGTSLGSEGASSAASCVACGVGTARPSPVWTRVSSPPGTFAETTGATSCEACPAGLFNDVFGSFNATGCEACPPGSFSDVAGTGNCTACFPARAARVRSPASRAVSHGRTFPAQRNATDLSQCEPRPARARSPPRRGRRECSPCPPGTFVDTLGAETCTLCPPARPTRISAGTQRTRARRAPSGPWRRTRACRGRSVRAGTYVEETGQTTCVPCPVGSYLPFGQSWIEDCAPCPTSPLGTFAA